MNAHSVLSLHWSCGSSVSVVVECDVKIYSYTPGDLPG
eukprot:SAG11_NODE_18307_length_494_cov_5.182278_1_plen_37_part_10